MSTQGLDVRAGKIWFAEPLTPGVIVRRPNRFIIEVDIDDRIVACHCPTTGRIGNLILDGLPCLLSRSHNPARKTPFTVEAISVDPPAATRRSWIGINQNAANRYIEEALRHDLLPDILSAATVQREKVLGASRLDFLVDDTTYVEVKTPLENLQIGLGDHITTRPPTPLRSTDRLARHIGELGTSLAAHERALLLVCFLYDNPGFEVQASAHHEEVKAHVSTAIKQGVEIWQVNFELDPTGVREQRQLHLTDQFIHDATGR